MAAKASTQGVGNDVGGVAVGKTDEHHEPAVSFHRRRDRGPASAKDQVAFPVTGNGIDDHGGRHA